MSDPKTTEAEDELTIIDDATGLSVSVPILLGASILSRSGQSALLVAEALLNAKIAEAANAR